MNSKFSLYPLTVLTTLLLICNVNVFAQSTYNDNSIRKERLYFNGFDQETEDWAIGTWDDNRTSRIAYGGFFEIKSLKTGTNPLFWTNMVNIDTDKDFEIETSFSYTSGEDNNALTLDWGQKDGSFRFRFGFSGNGQYIIDKYDGTWSNYKSWTESPLVNKTSPNKLTIRKIDGTYYFFLNETLVHEMPFVNFFGQQLGFQCNQNTTMQVDYISVSYINYASDYTGPKIYVYEPSVRNQDKIRASDKEIVLSGRLADDSGIYDLEINGVEANFDNSGEFSQVVKLAVGENIIDIKATDTKSNVSRFQFFVNRINDVQQVLPQAQVVLPQVQTDVNATVNANERRIALVIGNSAYAGGQFLKNPANDAALMVEALKGLGFEVISRTDADKKNMERAIREFSEKLPGYNVALFYYAGHGVQVDGMNYLVPTDAELNRKEDCKWEAISVNFIVEEFEKYPDNTNIVILDACRNDPFRSWSRGGERGFKAILPTSGTIISFATSEGATASDGSGANGLYTQELVKQLQAVQPIESVFKKTRVEVERLSNGAQSPQEWSKLKGDFWFKR
ncbi:MAG: caspase domain-containing protein [Bacteroidales bacterium]